MTDHSSCPGIYLYEGTIGRIVVQVASGTPPGDYTIDVVEPSIGDNFTDEECESHSARGAIIRVQ